MGSRSEVRPSRYKAKPWTGSRSDHHRDAPLQAVVSVSLADHAGACGVERLKIERNYFTLMASRRTSKAKQNDRFAHVLKITEATEYGHIMVSDYLRGRVSRSTTCIQAHRAIAARLTGSRMARSLKMNEFHTTVGPQPSTAKHDKSVFTAAYVVRAVSRQILCCRRPCRDAVQPPRCGRSGTGAVDDRRNERDGGHNAGRRRKTSPARIGRRRPSCCCQLDCDRRFRRLGRPARPAAARASQASLHHHRRPQRQAAFAYATHGRWRLPVDARTAVDPGYLRPLLAYEDRRAHSHGGVDPLALSRAALQLVTRGHIVSGGSTITMQLARLMERGATARFMPS